MWFGVIGVYGVTELYQTHTDAMEFVWSEKLAQVRVLSEHAHASLPSFDGVWSEKLAQVRVLSEHAQRTLMRWSVE